MNVASYRQLSAIILKLFDFQNHSSVIVWTIKDGDKPFDRIVMDKLLKIDADGGTPLADVYGRLLPVLTRWRIQKLVTFTDGVPDSVERTSVAIKMLQRKGIQMSAVSYRCLDLVNLPYDRLETIQDIDDLPKVLIKVLVGG